MSVLITGLLPNTEFKARIIAENRFGKSAPSEEVNFRTSEEAPSLIPANSVGNDFSVKLMLMVIILAIEN
ncbi:hypothetical protein B4U79_17864 [Dinothrombium tinctorium]|uniref:Fibronectin type-III domain-containing protein n=1 Tax=Dinothrombium tinctorium TaxID=1965070 RepID=A0A443RNA8_9ACAR|nr:hypothetical protein B4U79_17865 [Dinothrombium tinctorium]RWS16769.1 hypothetical protein B4U79_17864 [Dinothrombium tinctorium]